MSLDWADNTAQQLLSKDLIQKGICLILGASDTGKTTLAEVLAKHLAKHQPVGIIDADIGQSHVGPPATVGWAVVDNPLVRAEPAGARQINFSKLTVGGISFVGDVTPVGHLLQLTAAITQCVQQVSEAVELIIIDTPGFIYGSAAAALWWAVQRILKPKLILAVQRGDELNYILSGLRFFDLQLELVKSSPQIPVKSLQNRQNYRRSQFISYFRNAGPYNISLSNIAVQPGLNLQRESFINRVVGLRNENGIDMAIGVITDWQDDRGIVVVVAPKIDIRQVCCLVIGDITIDISGE
jgi:polynucleotide 5'-hydroxyl-kinase GRC3/NOL9